MGRTGFTLLDRPNRHGDHFYPTRRGLVLAIVVHITAGLEDLDAHDDHSAERTADYAGTTTRKVSWHSGSDTDSIVTLLPPEATAWHCQGYNSTTYGHEISKAHPDWRTSDPLWVNATLGRAAAFLGPLARRLGVPARHATRAELDQAIATNGASVGFIGHHELDPVRRADPGRVGRLDTFPWPRFLDLLAPQEDNMQRRYETVTVPPPDEHGRQLAAVPGYAWSKTGPVTIKANDNGIPVWADVQTCAYGDALVLSFVPLDGRPVPSGLVGVVISYQS